MGVTGDGGFKVVDTRPQEWRTDDAFYLGVDLGQSQDATTYCVLHAYAIREPYQIARYFYDVRHLERVPLGTPYPAIVADVGVLLQKPPLLGNCELVIDETGVGRPVGDMFAQAGLKPTRITITAGDTDSQQGDRRYHVAKSLLISNLDAKMHSGELRFAEALREAPALREELKDFTRHVSEAGRATFAARQGKHDDLVLALAIALWRATRRKPSFSKPQSYPSTYNVAHSGAKERTRRYGK